MEYIKGIISKEFKELHRAFKKSEIQVNPEMHEIHKSNIFPKLRGIVRVSRMIMNADELEHYLMSAIDLMELDMMITEYLHKKK